MEQGDLLLILIPLVVIQIALLGFALRDLFNSERRVKGGNKLVWALINLRPRGGKRTRVESAVRGGPDETLRRRSRARRC